MSKADARRLAPAAQEDLRRRVLAAVENGMRPTEAARTFQMSRQSIHNWGRAVEERATRRCGRTSEAHWIAARSNRLEMFLLPGYSPDLNPDEFLNQDVKSNALGRRRPATRTQMIDGVRSYLRGTQRRPTIVKSYFKAESGRYAS